MSKKSFTVLVANTYYPLYSDNEIVDYSKTTKEKPEAKIRASAKNDEIIVHPIFLELEGICKDPYWKSILIKASKGKFNKGLQFKNDLLTYKIKNKIFSSELSINNIYKSLDDFIFFMNENVGILSPEDIEKKNKNLKNKIEKLSVQEITSWTQVKKDLYKTSLINKYIDLYNEEIIKDGENPLTEHQKENMKSKILLGLNTNFLNNENIEIKNGFITNIVGLIRLDNGYFDLEFEKYNLKIKKQKLKKEEDEEINTVMSCTNKDPEVFGANKNDTPDFLKLWIKMLKGLEKRTVKYRKKVKIEND